MVCLWADPVVLVVLAVPVALVVPVGLVVPVVPVVLVVLVVLVVPVVLVDLPPWAPPSPAAPRPWRTSPR